jgi:hypothetical protein
MDHSQLVSTVAWALRQLCNGVCADTVSKSILDCDELKIIARDSRTQTSGLTNAQIVAYSINIELSAIYCIHTLRCVRRVIGC